MALLIAQVRETINSIHSLITGTGENGPAHGLRLLKKTIALNSNLCHFRKSAAENESVRATGPIAAGVGLGSPRADTGVVAQEIAQPRGSEQSVLAAEVLPKSDWQ